MPTFTTVQCVPVTVARAGSCSWARSIALFLSQIDSAVMDPACAPVLKPSSRALVQGIAASQAAAVGGRMVASWMLLCLITPAADGQGAIWKQALWRTDR